jgi:hypothetical protein
VPESKVWTANRERRRVLLGEMPLFMVVLLPLSEGLGRLRAFQQVPVQEIRATSRVDGEGFKFVLN